MRQVFSALADAALADAAGLRSGLTSSLSGLWRSQGFSLSRSSSLIKVSRADAPGRRFGPVAERVFY